MIEVFFLFVGHSAGGAGLHTNLVNNAFQNIKDQNGNSAVTLILNGAPVNYQEALYVASQKGVNFEGNNINSGDFVGNVLGNNNGIIQMLGSGTVGGLLLFTDSSPHSKYREGQSLHNSNLKNNE